MTIGKNNDTYVTLGALAVVLVFIGYGICLSLDETHDMSEIQNGQTKLAHELKELSQNRVAYP